MNNLILKLEGTQCNIDCTYCYEKVKDISYNGNLTLKYIEKILEENNNLNVLLHGGEPLMIGFNNMKDILLLLSKYKEKIEVVKLLTNGTLLNEEWCKLFFIEFNILNFELAISLDGDDYLNYLRVDYQNNNTVDSIIKAFYLVEKYNKKIGIFSVINQRHITNAGRYLSFFEKYKNIISFIKFNPLYASKNILNIDTNITPKEYTYFLKEIYFIWVSKNLYRDFIIEPIISYIQAIKGIQKRKYCEFKNDKYKCFKFNTIYPNGYVTGCDNLDPNDFYLGNIFRDNLNSLQDNFTKTNGVNIVELLYNKCVVCDIQELCGGGCFDARQKFLNTSLYDEYCIHRKEMFDFISQEIL